MDNPLHMEGYFFLIVVNIASRQLSLKITSQIVENKIFEVLTRLEHFCFHLKLNKNKKKFQKYQMIYH